MCLAIYQPEGIEIPVDYLRNGYDNNPDGAGFSYFDDNWNVKTYKALSFSKFIAAYTDKWEKHGQSSPFSIHFRWATHGTKGIENVHPFMVDQHTSLIHNGIIDCKIPNKNMSDTAAFVKHYLPSLPDRWYDNDYLYDMVQSYIGGSKLVILTAKPGSNHHSYIMNEQMGEWVDGVWYSNRGYCSYASPVKKFKYDSNLSYIEYVEQDDPSLKECVMCGELSAYDGVCYECETCQQCMESDDFCTCNKTVGIHALNDSQYNLFTGGF